MRPRSVIACCHLLQELNFTVAFAESVTAGRLFSEFSLIPDSGSFLLGSIVCYHEDIKKNILGVSYEAINQYTCESAEVTRELAIGLQRLVPADVILAVTGLASSGGSETEDKPVGTVFFHGIIKDIHWHVREQFVGTPEEIMMKAVDSISLHLLNALSDLSSKGVSS